MFKLEIKTDNAAFGDKRGAEIARILEDVGDKLNDGQTSGSCRDINGNTVGSWELTWD